MTNLSPEERQALREKHAMIDDETKFCVECNTTDGEWVPYPCDVVVTLNALDACEDNLEEAETHLIVVREYLEGYVEEFEKQDSEWAKGAVHVAKMMLEEF